MTIESVDSKIAIPHNLVSASPRQRVQRSREDQDFILDAFEASGMTAPQFAEYHNLNYQTFASWRRRRKRECESSQKRQSVATDAEFTFLEMSSAEQSMPDTGTSSIAVSLVGEAQAALSSEDQVPLVAALIKALA